MVRSKFDYAFRFLQDLEGWGEDHETEGDPGGRTIYGIAENYHPEMFKDGPPTLGEARSFCRRVYWDPLRLGEIENENIAAELLEFAYHATTPVRGKPSPVIRVAQHAVNDVRARKGQVGVAVDGLIGPQTIGALNALGVGSVESLAWDGRFNLYQLRYYRGRPRNLVNNFFLGWSRRVVA